MANKTEDITTQDKKEFMKRAREVSEIVSKWPEWKQSLLGGYKYSIPSRSIEESRSAIKSPAAK